MIMAADRAVVESGFYQPLRHETVILRASLTRRITIHITSTPLCLICAKITRALVGLYVDRCASLISFSFELPTVVACARLDADEHRGDWYLRSDKETKYSKALQTSF